MAQLKHVGAGSAFKVGLVLYAILGFVLGVFIFLLGMAGTALTSRSSLPIAGASWGVAAIIVCPIIYGIIGGVFAAIGAALYNLAAGWVGGLDLDIS